MELKNLIKILIVVTMVFIELVVCDRPIFLNNEINLGKNQLEANYPIFDIPSNTITIFKLKIDDSIKNSDININIGSQKESGEQSQEDTILLKFNEFNFVQGNTPFLVQLCTSANEESFNITCLNSDLSDCKLSISINASNTNNFCSQNLDNNIFEEFFKDFFNFPTQEIGGQQQQENGGQEQQQQQQDQQDQQYQQENSDNDNVDDGELRPIIKNQQQKQPKLKISRFNDETNNWFNNFFKNNI
ncbi:hypothetical protein RB653_005272 [Dictyostelium firmibasis]|uniref:Uncharacterized protein n=1 Tax=Dictyostelium firmibasis TaxID=79012 RepID=A0AAN7U0Z8_9MYCE